MTLHFRRLRQILAGIRISRSKTHQPSDGASGVLIARHDSNSLLGLPNEVLHLINHFLRLSEAVALALSCKTLLHKTTEQLFRSCSQNRPELLNLLDLLTRGNADIILCPDCAIIRETNFDKFRGRRTFQNKGCQFHDSDYFSGFFYTIGLRRIDSIQLLMVMKRHRSGLDTTQHLQYLNSLYPVTVFRGFSRPSTKKKPIVRHYVEFHQYTLAFKIVDSEMIIRWQLLQPHPLCHNPLGSIPARDLRSTPQALTRVCNHILPVAIRHHTDILMQQNSPSEKWNTLYQCSYCETEYQLNIYDFGPGSVATVVTKWMNLGSCAEIKDAKWNRHYGPRKLVGGRDLLPCDTYPLGSVRKAFEGSDNFDVLHGAHQQSQDRAAEDWHTWRSISGDHAPACVVS